MEIHGRLFYKPDDSKQKPYLIGSACQQCGDIHFPPKGACPNCLKPNTLQEVKIGEKGKISSFSILHVAPPGFPVPHVQAMVKLDEGPLVFSILKTEDIDSVALNQLVRLTIGPVRRSENGEEIVGWMYQPEGGR
ncbi:Zn-ribbon domain-containing OB-fold protein [Peribacillus glennii]|uniref:Zn-ribbon domain-containing OB-fold protein n=1 Tax=Peribacillus glennii TaxID=2303991 RepID=A0A372LFD3_9BACI|nr:Zn-ribbon domain-containing OB-fold protein [Peribacillus glennii]RFU64990.1 Zn-ribbon domain-containing OB-fold protein [Peribacillus glennii]